MKSILIIGTKDGGKSTTITEICKMLKPSKVFKLDVDQKKLKSTSVDNIYNNTFIIEVNGKFILVVAGAPTEQNRTLRVLVEICIEMNIQINFLLVSKRTSERKKGFDTERDINDLSKLIHKEFINRIPLVNENDPSSFKENLNWKNRITKLYKLVLEHL